jgi:hypothetical protein
MNLYMESLSCLLYLIGAVASLFLILGARWARSIVGFMAVLSFIGCMFNIMARKPLSVGGIIFCAFTVISVVLLFFRKHEPVA